jgi:hypothetical protein
VEGGGHAATDGIIIFDDNNMSEWHPFTIAAAPEGSATAL